MPSEPVLLCDANTDTVDMYAVGLALDGFAPLVAGDTPTAIEHLRHSEVRAIVVSAQTLAGEHWLTGPALKDAAAARHIPILLLSGRADWLVCDKAQELDCAALILTPCLPEALGVLVRAALANDTTPRVGSTHATS